VTICTISTREARQRVKQRQQIHTNVFERGQQAADALLYFSDYALNSKRNEVPGREVFTLLAKMQFERDHYGQAADYIQKAAETFEDQILKKAISMAQRDLATADELAKPQPPRRPQQVLS